VHKCMRTDGSECDRTGLKWAWAGWPRTAGLAHSGGWFAPLPCTRRIFNPKVVEAPLFAEGRAIHTRRPSTS
jgi:hypothetical protein